MRVHTDRKLHVLSISPPGGVWEKRKHRRRQVLWAGERCHIHSLPGPQLGKAMRSLTTTSSNTYSIRAVLWASSKDICRRPQSCKNHAMRINRWGRWQDLYGSCPPWPAPFISTVLGQKAHRLLLTEEAFSLCEWQSCLLLNSRLDSHPAR